MFEEVYCKPREQDFPVKWFKFIYPSSKPRMTKTSVCTPVHVAYSPLASMNHQLTIILHDGYPTFYVLISGKYIPPSIPTLCHLMCHSFHLCVGSPHPTKAPKHDLPSLAPPKREMSSSFSWTNHFKSPTSRPLCLDDPVLETLNQVNICLCHCVHVSLVTPSPFLFVTLMFCLCHCVHVSLVTPSPFLYVTLMFIHLQPNHSIPRPYHTSPSRFLCILKSTFYTSE